MRGSRSPLQGRWLRLALRAYPAGFRRRFARDLEALCAEMSASAYEGSGRRMLLDLIRGGLGARWDLLRDRVRGGAGSRRALSPPGRRGRSLLDGVVRDTGFALRSLRNNPGFALVAILSLALGIGANTAIFSVVNAAVLRTLPVAHPEELVVLHWLASESDAILDLSIDGWSLENAEGRDESSSFSIPMFERFAAADSGLESPFAFADLYRVNLRIDGQAEIGSGQVVSGGYYPALGIRPALGRLLGPADDRPEAEPVVVLEHGFWQRRFGGNRAVLGEQIHINGSPFTVVGVSAAGFHGALQVGDSADVSVPLAHQVRILDDGAERALGNYWWVHVMGRRAANVSDEQLAASLTPTFAGSVTADVPDAAREAIPELVVRDASRGMTERRQLIVDPIRTLAAVVGMVLLIACANLANLLLARSSARRREIAVRQSLGASRGRLVRQLLTESVALSLAGGALGVGLAVWGRGLVAELIELGDATLDSSLDARTLGFTVAVAVLTGLLFGLAPALRATRLDLAPALRNAGSRTAGSHESLMASRSLLVAQVALSLLLLVVAGLFVRTLQNLVDSATTFNADGVLLVSVQPSLSGYEGDAAARLIGEGLARLEALPGVVAATATSHSPVSGSMSTRSMTVRGYEPGEDERMATFVNLVGPGFIDTFEIPLLAGRRLTEADMMQRPLVAVINERFARSYFPEGGVVGGRFTFGREESGDDIEIVGVVADVPYESLQAEPMPTVLVPYPQATGYWRMTFALRTAADPLQLVPAVRAVLAEVEPDMPLFGVRTQTAQRDVTLVQERQFARTSALLGGLALALACIGLYGILSYTVLRRTREIGVRVALGAGRGDVLRLMLRELRPVALGIAIGLVAALVTTRWLESQLYGLEPTDPATLVGATLLLAAVACVAAWLPARRAASVDPVQALREG